MDYILYLKNLVQTVIDNFRSKIKKILLSNPRIQLLVPRNHAFRTFVRSRGAIVIEFAVAMPVLLILMMYIHDLTLMKRWSDQMDFVTLQMVNMIQNVSQKRTNKTITANDLRYAASAAYLTIFRAQRSLRHLPILILSDTVHYGTSSMYAEIQIQLPVLFGEDEGIPWISGILRKNLILIAVTLEAV